MLVRVFWRVFFIDKEVEGGGKEGKEFVKVD